MLTFVDEILLLLTIKVNITKESFLYSFFFQLNLRRFRSQYYFIFLILIYLQYNQELLDFLEATSLALENNNI